MPPPAVLQLQAPDLPLTAADLVGRVFRITRLNWKPFMWLFLVPSLVYDLSLELLWWLSNHVWSGYSPQLLAALGGIGVVTNVVVRLEIGVRTLAAMFVLSGQCADINEALQLANQRRLQAVMLTIPVVLADLTTTVLGTTYLTVLSSIEKQVDLLPQGVAELTGLALFGLYVVAMLPFITVCILNALFIATCVRDKLSMPSAVGRFFRFLFVAPGFVFAFLFVATVTYFTLGTAASLLEVIDLPPEFLQGEVKEVVTIICQVVGGILYAPVNAIWFSSLAVAGALLHYQVCIDVEGRDLQERIAEARIKRLGA